MSNEEGIVGRIFTGLCLFGFRSVFCKRSAASRMALRIDTIVFNITTETAGTTVY